MLSKLIFVVLAGRLIIHLVQGLPASKRLPGWFNNFFRELFLCDLCLGVWVYFIFCAFFRLDLVSWAAGGVYIPVVNEFITAASISWSVHIFILGLKMKYGSFSI